MLTQAHPFPVTAPLYDRLLSFVRRRVATSEEAEDVVQQLLVRLLQSDAPPDERFAAWVFRSARNAVIDVYRRGNRLQLASSAELDTAAEPSQELNSDEALVAACLEQLLEVLSEADRDALRSVDLQGTSQRDFAAQRGLTYVTAKSRVQRARKRLRQELEARCFVTLDGRGMPLTCVPRRPDCCRDDPKPKPRS